MLQSECPMCGRGVKFAEEHRGRTATCKACGERFPLTALSSPEPDAERFDPFSEGDEEHEPITTFPDLTGEDRKGRVNGAGVDWRPPSEQVTCPECRTTCQVDGDQLKKLVRCGHCDATFTAQRKPPSKPRRTPPARASESIFDLGDDESPPSPSITDRLRRAMPVICLVLFAGAAAVFFSAEDWVAWKAGDLAVVGIFASLAAIAKRRWPDVKPLQRFGMHAALVIGVLAAWWYSEVATYTSRWERDGLNYADTYNRDREMLKRFVWGERMVASGPMSASGKPHGKWTINGRDQWYWYGDECSEGDFHRWRARGGR